MKVLFVCLGNICRSPLAEGIFRQRADELGLHWMTDSAGTGGWHAGEAPDSRSVACAQSHGIDISDLRARQFQPSDLDEFDLVYAMDTENKQNILDMATSDEQRHKVKLILDEVFPGESRSVPDPYYGGEEGFEHVYQLLERAAEAVFNRVKDAG